MAESKQLAQQATWPGRNQTLPRIIARMQPPAPVHPKLKPTVFLPHPYFTAAGPDPRR